MSEDQTPEDPKVLRLPQRQTSKPSTSITEEIEALLAEADRDIQAPVETPQQPPDIPQTLHGRMPPEPGHRNAFQCPQCDRWTWRSTAECFYCEFNHIEHAAKLEAWARHERLLERRRRFRNWMVAISLTGFASVLLSSHVPQPWRKYLFSIGMGMVAASWVMLVALNKK